MKDDITSKMANLEEEDKQLIRGLVAYDLNTLKSLRRTYECVVEEIDRQTFLKSKKQLISF